MGKSVGDFIEVLDMLKTDAVGFRGAGVHENEPSCISDGGRYRAGCTCGAGVASCGNTRRRRRRRRT